MDRLQPPEWTDNQTMDVLFSPFRENRDVNPSSWDKKLKFWKDMILNYSRENQMVVFDSKTLPLVFERNGKVPVCLGVVVQDMLKDRQIRTLEDLYTDLNSGWLSWTIGLLVKKPIQWTVGTFVKKPLTWTFNRMFGNNNGSEPSVQYVMMELLKDTAENIFQVHRSSVKSDITDCVIGYDELQKSCAFITQDEHTFHLALLHLCKEHKCTITVTESLEKVITFARQGAQSPAAQANLSESDMKIYRLKVTERQLIDQIAELSKEMESLRVEAKSNLRRGEKVAAKNCLRRKKKTEAWKNNKEEALENMRHLISIIQQAETNKQVVDAYSSGVEAYKDIKQKYGLTTDRIDAVMDNVQDAYDMHTNLDESMAFNPLQEFEPSTEELELELNDLMMGSGDKGMLPDPPEGDPQQDLVNALCTMKLVDDPAAEVVEDEFGLPSVPTHQPSSPQRNPGVSRPGVGRQTPQKRMEKVPELG